MQKPTTIRAYLTNGAINTLSLLGIKSNGLNLELSAAKIVAAIAARKIRRLVAIVETIDRATLVAVKPGAITSEGDQVSEREICVVPHGEHP